jgi:hypothetical protein
MEGGNDNDTAALEALLVVAIGSTRSRSAVEKRRGTVTKNGITIATRKNPPLRRTRRYRDLSQLSVAELLANVKLFK